MKTTLQQRAQVFIAELADKGIDQVKIAGAAGVTKGAVNQWLSGGIKSMKLEYALGLQKEFGYNHRWLVMGEEPKFLSQIERPKFDANTQPAPLGSRPVPVISRVQAGNLREITDPYPPGAGFAIEYCDGADLSPWAFALEIEGDSMLPEFRPGDRVIIDPEIAPNPGDFVVARNTAEEATFKKYRPRGIDDNGNMVFELQPLNPDYPTMRSDVQHLEVIGVMVEHRKKYRRRTQ